MIPTASKPTYHLGRLMEGGLMPLVALVVAVLAVGEFTVHETKH